MKRKRFYQGNYTTRGIMSTLNYLCKHDVSDEDCYKCIKHGIVFRCPDGCPDFADVRADMTQDQLAERKRLMDMLGRKDPFELGESNR